MASEVSRRSVPPAFASVSTGSIVIASESPVSGGVWGALTDVLFRARVLEVFFLEPLAAGFSDVFTLATAVFGFTDVFTFAADVFGFADVFTLAADVFTLAADVFTLAADVFTLAADVFGFADVFTLATAVFGFAGVFTFAADVFTLAAVVFGFADFFTFLIVVFGTRSLFVFALIFFAVVVFPGRTVLPAEEAVRLFFVRPVADAARLEPESKSSTAVADLLFFAETRLAVGFLLTFRARDDFGF